MTTRRKVVLTGAVLATLSSRPAWTQDVCNTVISANAFASIAAGGSLSPAQQDVKDLLDRYDIEAVEKDSGNICIRQKPDLRSKLVRQRDMFKGVLNDD